MRRLIAVLIIAAAPLLAHAEARKYAVLSLVGDKLTIVHRELSTGSSLDKNTRETVPMPDASVDRAVLLAVDDALRRADPSASPVLLSPRDPNLFALVDRTADDSRGVERVFEAVRPVLAGTGATHLVLVTKFRSRARLRIRDGYVGSGFLEGMGFYLDQGTRARGTETNEAERGFIAPFAYLRVALVDVARARVLAEKHVTGSTVESTTDLAIGNAWSALSEEDKVKRLTGVIGEEMERIVPEIAGNSQ